MCFSILHRARVKKLFPDYIFYFSMLAVEATWMSGEALRGVDCGTFAKNRARWKDRLENSCILTVLDRKPNAYQMPIMRHYKCNKGLRIIKSPNFMLSVMWTLGIHNSKQTFWFIKALQTSLRMWNNPRCQFCEICEESVHQVHIASGKRDDEETFTDD